MKQWILVAVIIVMAMIGWSAYTASLRHEGALREQIAGLETRNARLEDEAGRIDTVYRTDTITLRKVRYATDTLLQRDTVIHTDTVRQIIAQERAACSAVISTCERAKANLVAQLANRDSVITAIQRQRPSWLSRTLTKVTWAAIGYTAGSVLHK